MKLIKDYPIVASTSALVLVLIHAACSRWTPVPPLSEKLTGDQNAYSLYLSTAGVLALVAGFAGVAIVFALTPGVAVLERARARGGDRLRATWASLVSTPILASLIALGAAACALANRPALGGWLFELAALLTLVASARLVWVFRLLVRLDVDEKKPTKVQALDLIEHARRRA